MRSIFIKEINSFFSSIVGYVVLLVFLVFCGIVLWISPATSILTYGYATLDRFFTIAPWLLLLLIPAVTMRSFSDEFRGGTIEWLSTKPVSTLDIILGKYMASVMLIVFALIPTLIYVYTIDNLSAIRDNIDFGAIIGSYTGLLLIAGAFAAIGVFCSSLTSNQIVGLLLSIFACVVLYSGFEVLGQLSLFQGGAAYYISMAGMSYHYASISQGVIDSRDVIYFLSVIVLFISLTRLSLGRRTWDTARQ